MKSNWKNPNVDEILISTTADSFNITSGAGETVDESDKTYGDSGVSANTNPYSMPQPPEPNGEPHPGKGFGGMGGHGGPRR